MYMWAKKYIATKSRRDVLPCNGPPTTIHSLRLLFLLGAATSGFLREMRTTFYVHERYWLHVQLLFDRGHDNLGTFLSYNVYIYRTYALQYRKKE